MYRTEKQKTELPDISALLSSLVRLMSSYVKEPSTSHIMSLVHLIKQLQEHPDLSANPTVEIAIRNAQIIWQEELLKSRRCFEIESSTINTDKKSIH